MAQILTPDQFQPNMQINAQLSMDIQRLAIGMDMLVGLLSEYLGYELKETSDENGNTVLRWRPKGAETTEGSSEAPTGSEA